MTVQSLQQCLIAVHEGYSGNDRDWEMHCAAHITEHTLAPPFNEESARQKVQRVEDLWNTRDPDTIIQAYTGDCTWRDCDEILEGHAAIKDCLIRKWQKELNYYLTEKLFLFSHNKISVESEYTWHNEKGQHFRSHGLEHWEFADDGRLSKRTASIHDVRVVG